MAKHFYELTLEITECHPQSSTVYLGSPQPGPKEADTDPSTGGEECQITLKEEQVRLESML